MHSEERLQSEFYIWFHNSYPQYRGLLCYNLNNSKNKIDGARNRSLGLQQGRSDMTFYWKGKAYFLELKNEIGRQSPGQIKWQGLVESHGFYYSVFKDHETLKLFIKSLVDD